VTNAPDRTLAGRIALITGAGRGIGRAIACAYARAGAHVVVASRTASDLDALVDEIAASGGRATAVPTDVASATDVERLFAACDAVGGLDIAVLNAGGIPARGPVADSDPDGWRAVFEVNFFAAYLCARAAIPRLRSRGGGKVILVGSGVGHRGTPEFAAYACAKAAQWMFTRVLAQELAPEGISVNELIPGPVSTSIGDRPLRVGSDSPFPTEWAKTPEDVVPLALFLATLPDHGPSAQSFSLMRRDG
jgi:3-oxoacyl-[acyl-carrier protein] reductase